MQVLISTEQHFIKTPDGVFMSGNEDYPFFARYLSGFQAVRVLGRMTEAATLPPGYKRADGAGVSIEPLPPFRGVAALLRNLPVVTKAMRRVLRSWREPIILRVPGPISTLSWVLLTALRRPYSLEVVTDPGEAFQQRAFGSSLGSILRPIGVQVMRAQCRRARCVSYVTGNTLQTKYPNNAEFSTFYSSVELPPNVFGKAELVLNRLQSQPDVLEQIRLCFVGRLSRPFKGLDTLLQAVSQMNRTSRRVQLDVIGGGQLLEEYQQQAASLEQADSVHFFGEIASGAVVLDTVGLSDMFILPSRREGLPRALLEAMAIGMPCIATPVGGIPEVLHEDDLVPVDDTTALVAKIEELAASRQRRLEAGRRNLVMARDFSSDVLSARRTAFYQAVRRTSSNHGSGGSIESPEIAVR